MRRDMEQLVGDVWAGSPARRAPGYAPRVDVYYCGEPRRAIVEAELPGIDLEAVDLKVHGRTLVISGERPVRDVEGRTYQQVELPSGRFRRAIELGADVDPDAASASYQDGILRVELPLRVAPEPRQVPIQRAE